MHLLKYAIITLVLSVIAQLASANDSISGDDNGTIFLAHQPNISMDKEVLLISEKQIRVDYIFTNTSKEDIQAPVTFPMPPIYYGDGDHSSIEDFKLWINGQPAKFKSSLSVKLENGADISKQFAELGWSSQEVVSFVEDEKVPAGKSPLPKNWFADGMPKFTMSDYFTWLQNFPAGKPITISHTYTPSKSSSVPQSSEILFQEFGKSTCIDAATRAGIKKREDANGVNWSFLSYILVTANNWQGPIKDFDLTIKKKNAADLMSLCFEGELRKTDPLTFKFHAKNFSPKENLNILFIGKKAS